MEIKFYSNKSNAKRAAKKQFGDISMLGFIETEAGWTWEEIKNDFEVAQLDVLAENLEMSKPVTTVEGDYTFDEHGTLIAYKGSEYCPHCGVHLSNGIGQHGDVVNKTTIKHEQFEYVCLGCDTEFGNPIHKIGGIKIEKDREERNGIKKPSIGGKCRAVWDFCENYHNKTGIIPTPKTVKQYAVETDTNVNNAVIELYQWRRFMGFRGR